MSALFTVIKNNLKLIIRNKALVIGVMLGMILVIAALSNAFHNLLDSAEANADFSVSYQASAGSEMFEEAFTQALSGQDIGYVRINGSLSEDRIEKMISSGETDVFVTVAEDGFKIYGSTKSEIGVRTVQYIIHMIEANTGLMKEGKAPRELPEISEIRSPETADAAQYYSKVQLVYFITLASIFIAIIIREERRNKIGLRYKLGSLGKAGIYFSKLIPVTVIALLAQVLTAGGIVTLLFDVKWGNLPLTALILVLTTIAFASFGIIFFQLFKNTALSIGLLFMIIWFCGYSGGTFETYMYSSFPDIIKRMSPLYYVNRSLIELSLNGESRFALPCILILTGIAAVSIPAGIALTARKES